MILFDILNLILFCTIQWSSISRYINCLEAFYSLLVASYFWEVGLYDLYNVFSIHITMYLFSIWHYINICYYYSLYHFSLKLLTWAWLSQSWLELRLKIILNANLKLGWKSQTFNLSNVLLTWRFNYVFSLSSLCSWVMYYSWLLSPFFIAYFVWELVALFSIP